jgi:hypothetical protein
MSLWMCVCSSPFACARVGSHPTLVNASKVAASTQPSFLQEAVYLNKPKNCVNALGKVSRRFIVSPDMDQLLEELEEVDRAKKDEPDMYDGLTRMDIDP